jgi:hypothetical protein
MRSLILREPSLAGLAAALTFSAIQAQQIFDRSFANGTMPCRMAAAELNFDLGVEFSLSRQAGARLRAVRVDIASAAQRRGHARQSRIQLTVEQRRS